jgi:hypothetical protein
MNWEVREEEKVLFSLIAFPTHPRKSESQKVQQPSIGAGTKQQASSVIVENAFGWLRGVSWLFRTKVPQASLCDDDDTN